MKEFNLKEAKAGKPVCTRDGRPVRIICFDRTSVTNRPIVALISYFDGHEDIFNYTIDGRFDCKGVDTGYDLMMDSENHEGWINLYKNSYTGGIRVGIAPYSSKERAIEIGKCSTEYIATVKIEWEE